MVQSLFMSFKVTDKIAPSPNTELRLLLSYFHCLVEPRRVDSVPVLRPKWNRQYSLLSTISTLLENVNRIEKVKRKESRYTLQKTLLKGQLVKHKFMTQTMINYLNRSCYRILLCLPLSSKAKGGNSSNGDRSMNLLAAVFTLRMAGRLESEFGKKGTFQACYYVR